MMTKQKPGQWPRPRPIMEPLSPNPNYRPLPMPTSPVSSTRPPAPRIKKARTEHDVLAERSKFYPVYRYNGGAWQYYSDGAGGRLHFPSWQQAEGFIDKRGGIS